VSLRALLKKGTRTMIQVPVGWVEVEVLQHFLPKWGSRIGIILGLIQAEIDVEIRKAHHIEVPSWPFDTVINCI
jgi:hypothetical protein